MWWLPPENVSGTLEAFTVSVLDSNNLQSNYRARVSIVVSGVNAKPVVVNKTPAALTGATQNIPFVITYQKLLETFGVTDVDSSYTSFVVTSTSNGQFKKGTTTVSAFTGAPAAPPSYSVIAPSESLVYFPTTNLSGNDIQTVKIRAYDGAVYSDDEGTLKVNVAQVNQRPQINAVYNSPDGVRNETLQIPFSTLAQGLGATDLEDVLATDPIATRYQKLSFRVEQVLGGQSLKVGPANDEAGANLFDANHNTVEAGESVYWQPPANSAGVFEAFTVSVIDSGNLSSAIVAKVAVTVSGSDQSPTITNLTPTIGGAGIGATENKASIIPYETLAGAGVLGVEDTDSSWVSLVVTATSNGVFKKGSNTLAIFTGMPSAPPNTAVVAPNESITYMPTANLNGEQIILKVRAYDGSTYSANEATVKLNIVPVNTAPRITTLNDFIITNQGQGQPISFSYDALRLKTDVFDVEEVAGTKTIGFKIKSIAGGQIYRTDVTPKTLLTLDSVLAPNQTFEWNPPQILSGRLEAFTVVAVDDAGSGDYSVGLESAVAFPVYFNTEFKNSKPVFLSSGVLSGAVEDTPFVISHTLLAGSFAGSDVESGTLTYRITALGEGQYWKKGATTFTSVDLPVDIKPGESLSWMPPANRHLGNHPDGFDSANQVFSDLPTLAFKIRLLDGNNEVSEVENDVRVNIASVNDTPVFGANNSLASTTKNKVGGQLITWTDLKNAIAVSDLDNTTDEIQYRVENVSSGTLKVGTTDQGANVSLMTQMPYFVKDNPNGVTTSTDFNWTPPLNGVGNFVVMKVRAFDGKDFSVTTAEVRITVTGENTEPEIVITNVVLGKTGTGTVGTSQNVPLVISYDTLLAQTQARDADQTPVRFQIVRLDNGSVLVAGKTYNSTAELNPPAVVGPGEKFTWTPSNAASGLDPNAVLAFGVKAYDMNKSSTDVADVRVNVTTVNQPPTLNQEFTFAGVQRNAEYFEVSFETLAEELNVQDPEDVTGTDYSKVKFRVEQILGGQGLKVGNAFNTALIVDSVNNLFIPGQKLYWTPPANTTGIFDAFTVTVLDNNSLPSSTTGKVKMNVSGDNKKPTMAATANQTPSQTSTATLIYSTLPSQVTENTPFLISYNTLKTIFDLKDVDSPLVTFVITSIGNGSFKKSNTSLVSFPGAGVSAPPANAVLAPGESMLYYPQSGLSGTGNEVLRVMAYDGATYSASTGVMSVNIAPVNHAPTLTTTSILYTGTRNAEREITFETLATSLGVQDQDTEDINETSGFNNMKFRIEQILNGQTLRVGSTSSTATLVDSANNVLLPGQSIFWMPPTNSTGVFETFLVTAVDKLGASSMSVGKISINVQGNNIAPTIVATPVTLANAAEQNLQYVITYDTLYSTLQANDTDSPWLSFVVTHIENGALIKGSTLLNGFSAASSGTAPPGTSVLAPTESMIYMPTTNLNGNNTPVFKVRAYDGAAYSNEIEVKVNISRKNLPPLLTRVNEFTNIDQGRHGVVFIR